MSVNNKIIKCAKCQNNAKKDPWVFRDEFTTSYPIRDNDGQIYCWDCYKNKSHCEGCGKSVANIKFPRSGQPEYPHCNGGVSYNCERISNDVKFICSKKCSEDIFNRKYQNWKDKLNQGWTKCEKCIKRVNQLIKWFNEDGIKNGEWLKEEKHQSRFIKLVPPGQGKLCLEKWGCKWGKEVGKPRLKKVRAEAQKYWKGLSYDERLREVIRSRNAKQVGWREDLTAEQFAIQNEVPGGIKREFELRNAHHDCSDCHLEKDFKNSNGNNNLSCSTEGDSFENDNKTEKLAKELIEAKRQGKSQEEIKRLESELQKLNNQQQKEGQTKPTKNNDLLILGAIILLVSTLILGVILVNKTAKSKKNN